jgi:hypothetical protein
MDRREILERREWQVTPQTMVQSELPEIEGRRASLELLETLVIQVPLERTERKEKTEKMVNPVAREVLETQEQPGYLVNAVLVAQRESRVKMD